MVVHVQDTIDLRQVPPQTPGQLGLADILIPHALVQDHLVTVVAGREFTSGRAIGFHALMLGKMYQDGIALPRNDVAAHNWVDISERWTPNASGWSTETPDGPVPLADEIRYNGAPAWTPRSSTEGCNTFEYTFIDVGRLRPDETKAHEPVAALSSPRTAADRNRRYWESPTATLICTGHATILPAEAPKEHDGERAADHAT